eukprot:10377804-Alexandrium_andersonii.AAC.1
MSAPSAPRCLPRMVLERPSLLSPSHSFSARQACPSGGRTSRGMGAQVTPVCMHDAAATTLVAAAA